MSATIVDRSSTGDNDAMITLITTCVNLACVLFALIVIPLTSLVLFVLVRGRAYSRSPFFTICKVGFVFDIISLLTQLLLRAFPSFGLFAQFFTATPFPAKLTYFLIYFTRTGQALTSVFICLNRASAILLPLSHEKIWDNFFLLPICITSELVLSIVFGFLAGSLDVYWIRYPHGQLFSTPQHGPNLRVFLRAVFVPVVGIVLLIISVYIGISYQFRRKHMTARKKESISHRSVENKQASSLFYVAVCSVAMEIVYFATFFYAFIYSADEVGRAHILGGISLHSQLLLRSALSSAVRVLLFRSQRSVEMDRRVIRGSTNNIHENLRTHENFNCLIVSLLFSIFFGMLLSIFVHFYGEVE